ncbi:MAG: hypothetical protein IAG10_05845 [Planctomycetaceae bacterium]|nr:hypothetical protein [Planctomycetaceae bacterium]
MADERGTEPSVPRGTDEENPVIDTTSSKPLREAKIEEPDEKESQEEERVAPGTNDRNFKEPRPGFDGLVEPT